MEESLRCTRRLYQAQLKLRKPVRQVKVFIVMINTIRMDVDDAISRARTEKQFFYLMKEKEYTYKVGKDITFRAKGRERGVKLARNYGEEYTMDNMYCEIDEFIKLVQNEKTESLINTLERTVSLSISTLCKLCIHLTFIYYSEIRASKNRKYHSEDIE